MAIFWAYGVQCISSVYWFYSGLYILSLPIYIFWLEIFNNIFITHMYNNNNNNNENPKKIFQTPVILNIIINYNIINNTK